MRSFNTLTLVKHDSIFFISTEAKIKKGKGDCYCVWIFLEYPTVPESNRVSGRRPNTMVQRPQQQLSLFNC